MQKSLGQKFEAAMGVHVLNVVVVVIVTEVV